jgi:hypothetical protein
MPVNRKMMKAMKEQYGPEKGERIYYAKEAKDSKKMMNKMKKGYAEGGMASKEEAKPGNPKRKKEVPADNPGLAKLPKQVRNRMGYMADGGMVVDQKDPFGKTFLKKGGMVSKKTGYAKGGMVKANCGASVKPNRKSKS